MHGMKSGWAWEKSSWVRTSPIVAVLAALMLSVAGSAGAEEPVSAPLDYRIAAEDVLQVSVWKEEGLEREVIVRPDGGISFPLVGNVVVAGKTPAEVESEIASRLQRFIPDAVVTVSVVRLQGMRVYVTGQVKNPGQFTVGRYVDVLQAITLAGGLTPFAKDGDIKIIRRTDGREVIYKFNFGEVRRGQSLDQNIVLQTDDVVVVP
jgi:polysaccharide export outer membrane protein